MTVWKSMGERTSQLAHCGSAPFLAFTQSCVVKELSKSLIFVCVQSFKKSSVKHIMSFAALPVGTSILVRTGKAMTIFNDPNLDRRKRFKSPMNDKFPMIASMFASDQNSQNKLLCYSENLAGGGERRTAEKSHAIYQITKQQTMLECGVNCGCLDGEERNKTEFLVL